MHHASADPRLMQIAHARQAVLSARQSASGLNDWITASWQRCLRLGHTPEQSVGFDMVSQAHQKRMREAHLHLRQAALPVMQELAKTIAPIHYFAILTNAQGVVVSASGQIDQKDRRASLITREGVDLSEAAIGTSAIGAALHQKHDVWLHRGEHFFQDTSVYSCAGSPIFDGQGQCVGMLDVTGIEVPERPQLVHLVGNAARRIENQLVLAARHTLVVHLRWPGDASLGREAEGLLCLDEDGQISAMNRVARQMLGMDRLNPSTRHASDVFALPWQDLYQARWGEQALLAPLWSGLHVEVRSSRSGKLAPRRQPGGAVDTRIRQPVAALKAHETDLIRDTVTQLKGNVAAAAEKLGISRATIYRRLGRKA